MSDPSLRGLTAAERIANFRHELDIDIEQTGLILNRVPGEIPPLLQARIDAMDIPLLGVVPVDEQVMAFEFSGRPLLRLWILCWLRQRFAWMVTPGIFPLSLYLLSIPQSVPPFCCLYRCVD